MPHYAGGARRLRAPDSVRPVTLSPWAVDRQRNRHNPRLWPHLNEDSRRLPRFRYSVGNPSPRSLRHGDQDHLLHRVKLPPPGHQFGGRAEAALRGRRRAQSRAQGHLRRRRRRRSGLLEARDAPFPAPERSWRRDRSRKGVTRGRAAVQRPRRPDLPFVWLGGHGADPPGTDVGEQRRAGSLGQGSAVVSLPRLPAQVADGPAGLRRGTRRGEMDPPGSPPGDSLRLK